MKADLRDTFAAFASRRTAFSLMILTMNKNMTKQNEGAEVAFLSPFLL